MIFQVPTHLATIGLALLMTVGVHTNGRTQRGSDPDNVTRLTGRIIDAKTGNPVEAHLEFWKLPDGDNVGIYELPQAGEFDMVVNNQAEYLIDVVAPGYFPFQTQLSMYEEELDEPFIEKDFSLRPLAVGEILRLENLNFELNKYNILPESYPTLNQVVRLLTLNPALEIQLEGHTDIQGTNNFKLSRDRVRAIGKFLMDRGVAQDRLEYKAFGGTQPLVKSGSVEQRAVNRRVEVRVTKI